MVLVLRVSGASLDHKGARVVLLDDDDADSLYDTPPVMALGAKGVLMALNHFLNPNDSIRSSLTAAIPLVVASAPDETPVV